MSVSYLRVRARHHRGLCSSPCRRNAAAEAARPWPGPPDLGPDPTRPTGGVVVIDPGRRTAWAGSRALELTRREFDLLAHLVGRPQQVFSRAQLLHAVWQQPDVGGGRTIDVHMTRLAAQARRRPPGVARDRARRRLHVRTRTHLNERSSPPRPSASLRRSAEEAGTGRSPVPPFGGGPATGRRYRPTGRIRQHGMRNARPRPVGGGRPGRRARPGLLRAHVPRRAQSGWSSGSWAALGRWRSNSPGSNRLMPITCQNSPAVDP
ncbi:winged helix-turn-helix domain-containing protein [Streptacidiphilus sp. MAP5-52]|uniref:winged helix-turn-helix domain-containing protein n=1 Tax=Streptacidiphilus sp. MAP5-52 TaxID=3156267 RepID=UPI003515AB82